MVSRKRKNKSRRKTRRKRTGGGDKGDGEGKKSFVARGLGCSPGALASYEEAIKRGRKLNDSPLWRRAESCYGACEAYRDYRDGSWDNPNCGTEYYANDKDCNMWADEFNGPKCANFESAGLKESRKDKGGIFYYGGKRRRGK